MVSKLKTFLKQRFPSLSGLFSRFRQSLGKAAKPGPFPPFRKVSAGIKVCYLTEKFPQRPPTRGEQVSGGSVKMLYLAEAFPHSFPTANILYTISSVGHMQTPKIVAKAKEKNLKIVVNQNGVAYPAWHGAGWEATNCWLSSTLEQADFIIYQSRFCQLGAEKFLSPPRIASEVLHNPVDTRLFLPATTPKPKNLTLLLGGNQNQRYRLELALQTLEVILKDSPNARLIVTGSLWKPAEESRLWAANFLREHHLTDHVTFAGRYSQTEAPAIFHQAHLLLHTQYHDASPTLVLEAMASGLPVAYIESGGVPELVAEAGVGVPVESSWEKINLPAPEALAKAVSQIRDGYQAFSAVARQRAVEQFSLEIFISKHRRIFEQVLES